MRKISALLLIITALSSTHLLVCGAKNSTSGSVQDSTVESTT